MILFYENLFPYFLVLFNLISRFVLNRETDFLSPIFIVVRCLIDASWKS